MSGLLEVEELAALREVAELGMTTTVNLLRLKNSSTATGSESDWVSNGTVSGWLYSTPSPVITMVSGEMALVNTYRLFLPVGTDIESGDRVTISGSRFTVSDTTAESTWLPLLTVSLRRVE